MTRGGAPPPPHLRRATSPRRRGEVEPVARSAHTNDLPPHRHHPRLAAALARDGAARAVHALAGARDLHRLVLLDAAAAPSGAFRRPRQLRDHRRRPGVLALARQQHVLRARHHSALDRARDPDGAVGQRPHRRPHADPHGVLYADHPADDRGRQHLAVLLHAAIRPARADRGRARLSRAQLARFARNRARRRHDRGDLEGGGLLHDLLSGGAAVDLAEPRRRRLALDVLLPRAVSAADADHAVGADQRRDQRLPHRRPHHRDDARRAGQCHHALALLHLPGRLHVLGYHLRGRAHHRAPGAARTRGVCAIRFPRTADPLPMSAVVRPDPCPPSGVGRAIESAAAGLFALLWILPLAYAVWAAFHPGEFTTRFALTAPLTLENFERAWVAAPFARYFLNTFVLVTLTLGCQLVLCTLAAYAFARYDFAGSNVAFALVLAQLMIMPDVLIVENYRTMGHIGLIDTIPAIALPYVASAFGIFLLRQTFKTVPKELDDAARVEGASPLQVLLKVYVPLARPIYVAYGLVSVSYHSDNLLSPLIGTNPVEARPLPVGLQVFSSADQGIDWAIICAATLMTSGPLLLGFLLFQRQFVQSFMRAGIR